MKFFTSIPCLRFISLFILLALGNHMVAAADFQLISAARESSASGNGDSGCPVISADGRYVLFSSSANNLVLTNNAGPVPATKLRWQNVFLRDRTGGSNILISVNAHGDGGNWNSWPCGISTNGQFVLFESSASDLVVNDTNNNDDVFIRDVAHGITTLVSVNTNGISGNGNSHGAVMTPDGRYVVFVSAATDLVPNDTNGIPDLFIRNLQSGTTTCLSPGAISTGSAVLPSTSESPTVTPDGRYIAFYSTATNLVSGNQLVGGIYACDRLANTIVCVSSNAGSLFQPAYNTTNAFCCSPLISDDGRFISFLACDAASLSSKGMILRFDAATAQLGIVHTNAYVPSFVPLVDRKTLDQSPNGQFVAFIANNPATSGNTIIYLRDMVAGTNIVASADRMTGLAVSGFCDAPVVDASGRYVTFTCNGANLTALPLTGTHIYVRDTQLGSAQVVDLNTNGIGVGFGANFSISTDAHELAFEATVNSFVANDGNGDWDVVARDLTQGTNELISAAHPWQPAWTPDRFCKLYPSCISTNARFVAFTSEADNLVTNDFNGCGDVFVRDTLLGTNILASMGTNGMAAAGISSEPSLSGDGNFVTYSSWATNIVAGDTNRVQDVFVYSLPGGTNLLVSATPGGGFGNSNSYSPQISADGSFVMFRSRAQNLAAGVFTGENLFLRNLQSKTSYALTTGAVVNAAMTFDGHYLAYVGVASGSSAANLYVWDSAAAKRIYTNTTSALGNVAISPDGRWVAYASSSTLSAYDLVGKISYTVATGTFDGRAGLQFSADDRWLTFVTKSKVAKNDLNGTYDIYLHDFQNNTNILVSQSFNTTNAASSASYFPSLSPDGRFVAYQSIASNLVPNDTNNLADIYVYDRLTGTTILITTGQNGNSSANNFSQMPIFSGDSRSLVFASYAANFSDPSFNEYNAIYVLNLFATGNGDSVNNQTNGVSANLAVTGNGASGQTPGQPPVITWPSATGKFYQVQFKNNLSDPAWQNLNGSTTQVGAQGQAIDLGATGQSQRFYRIILSN